MQPSLLTPSRPVVPSPRLALLEAIAAADQDVVERKMGGRHSVFANDPQWIGEAIRPELLMTLRPSAPIWMRVGRA
jgi:hypothetical protein